MDLRSTIKLLSFLVVLLLLGCQSESKSKFGIDNSEFILQDGFEIELIAAEPLLDSPVAMSFDNQGRIWVVELPGYMRDIDGTDENRPDGKVVLLLDNDGDGIMDDRKVFLDSLIAPRALLNVYNGLMFTESSNLWWVETKGDRPGNKVLVDSMYIMGGNIEHQPNSLTYGMDNWIYSAKCNARYRRIDGEWKKEATSYRGQWGLTQDDAGRLYYNDNSNPLYGDYTFPNQAIAHPYQRARFAVQQQIATDRRVYPYQATAVNRGYQEETLDDENKLVNLTSACSPVIYRGKQFPQEFHGDAFICAPEVNMVKRYTMDYSSARIKAEQAYTNEEFLVSKDETFRPVNLYNGMNGELYILDMRKGVIQHRAYMTSYLRDLIKERKLDEINGKGRIYSVVSSRKSDGPSSMELALIPRLGHPNGRVRSHAQQEIVESGDKSLQPLLEELSLDKDQPKLQIHALWALEGLDLLSADLLASVSQLDNESEVQVQLLRLMKLFPEASNDFLPALDNCRSSDNEHVLLQLCHTIGSFGFQETKDIVSALVAKFEGDSLFNELLISGVYGKEEALSSGKSMLAKQLAVVRENQSTDNNVAPKIRTTMVEDNRTLGFHLYNQYCLSCHGPDGTGLNNLAPPLLNSEYIDDPIEKLVLIALHGFHGPVTVDGKEYEMNTVMPGIGQNPQISDKDIAHLIIFIRNAFSTDWAQIDEELVRDIRERTADRNEMFTAETLEAWITENIPEKIQ